MPADFYTLGATAEEAVETPSGFGPVRFNHWEADVRHNDTLFNQLKADVITTARAATGESKAWVGTFFRAVQNYDAEWFAYKQNVKDTPWPTPLNYPPMMVSRDTYNKVFEFRRRMYQFRTTWVSKGFRTTVPDPVKREEPSAAPWGVFATVVIAIAVAYAIGQAAQAISGIAGVRRTRAETELVRERGKVIDIKAA